VTASTSRARDAVVDGLRSLARAPAVTAAATLAAVVAALAPAAAARRAATLVEHAARTGGGGALGAAALTLGVGLAFASLLVEVALAAALSAYAAPGALPGPRALALGLRRAPALITLGAVEATVYVTLVTALALALPPPGHAPSTAAAAALDALGAAPALALAAVLFASTRVAVVLVARGVPAAPSLASGLDVALRRLPSLVRLGALLCGATLPLVLAGGLAALCAWRAVDSAPFASVAAACLQLAALWSYAALSALVGRDPRLVTG
jgi:hypothetical protein